MPCQLISLWHLTQLLILPQLFYAILNCEWDKIQSCLNCISMQFMGHK